MGPCGAGVVDLRRLALANFRLGAFASRSTASGSASSSCPTSTVAPPSASSLPLWTKAGWAARLAEDKIVDAGAPVTEAGSTTKRDETTLKHEKKEEEEGPEEEGQGSQGRRRG